MAQDRATLLKRVRLLLAMRIENGCTENEAMNAAAKAALLMQEHDLSYSDVESVKLERYGWRTRVCGTGSAKRQRWPESLACFGSVARFFDCRSLLHWPALKFFGTEHDTALAFQFLTMLESAIAIEVAAYLATRGDNATHGRTLRASFIHGMTDRLNVRMYKLRKAREGADTRGSNALVVVKGAEVARRYEQAKPDGVKEKPQPKPRNLSDEAYKAGEEAANRAALGTDAKLGESVKIAGPTSAR